MTMVRLRANGLLEPPPTKVRSIKEGDRPLGVGYGFGGVYRETLAGVGACAITRGMGRQRWKRPPMISETGTYTSLAASPHGTEYFAVARRSEIGRHASSKCPGVGRITKSGSVGSAVVLAVRRAMRLIAGSNSRTAIMGLHWRETLPGPGREKKSKRRHNGRRRIWRNEAGPHTRSEAHSAKSPLMRQSGKVPVQRWVCGVFGGPHTEREDGPESS